MKTPVDGAAMAKPFPPFSRESLRSAFWELTIGFWIIAATLVIGGTIAVAVTTRNYEFTLVFFVAGIGVGALFGPVMAAKVAYWFVHERWRRDRYEEELDRLDSYEDGTKGPSA